MKFRISNGRSRAIEFDASTPHALMSGIRSALSSWVQPQPGREGHPLMQLRARLAWADRWLAERLARPGLTVDRERTLHAQAITFRTQALTAADVMARVELHFEHSGEWRYAAIDPTRRRDEIGFERDITLPECIDIWTEVQAVAVHIEGLTEMGRFVAEAVSAEMPTKPTNLRLV